MMLRNEAGGSVLSRREGGAVDNSPKLPFTIDQRILHRRQLLIETDLVFFEAFTTDKAAFVFCLFRITFSVYASNPASLDTVTTDLFETGPRAIDKDDRLHNLLDRELSVFRVLFRLRFRVLFSLLFRWLLGMAGRLGFAGQAHRN